MLNHKDSQQRRDIVKPAHSPEGKRQAISPRGLRVEAVRRIEIEARFLNEFEIAGILGVSVATVRRWRLVGRGPMFLKVAGSLVRYPVEALNVWLASQPSGGDPTVECPVLQGLATSHRESPRSNNDPPAVD